jgi:hypothetical protein
MGEKTDLPIMRFRHEIKEEQMNKYTGTKFEIGMQNKSLVRDLQKPEYLKYLVFESKIPDIQSQIDEFNKIKKEMLEKNNSIYDKNVDAVDKFYQENDVSVLNVSTKEELEAKVLKGFCYLAKNADLSTNFKKKNPMGIFFSCDWHLSQNEFNYLR